VGALPAVVEEVLNRALVCEFTVIGPGGRPITHPMIPLYDGEKVYLHSSILFSKKLGHVKANPKISIAITDLGATHGGPLRDRILIQGDAVVVEDDPHTTWERILPLWIAKEPIVKQFYAKRVALPLFWERSLIEITPRKTLVWLGGRTDAPPQELQDAGVTS
jgi:nitroimidazol reductase NimA-like FMN-containing flavoprotein (pyridoxamine 5'-phosphate oxidase superfamily)